MKWHARSTTTPVTSMASRVMVGEDHDARLVSCIRLPKDLGVRWLYFCIRDPDAQEAPLDDDSAPPLARSGEAAGDGKQTGEMGGEGLENEGRCRMRRMESPRYRCTPMEEVKKGGYKRRGEGDYAG
jgi:hypothetical protein